MNSASLKKLFRPLQKPLMPIVQHHAIIAIVVVFGFLIFALYTVSQQVLQAPTDDAYREKQLKNSVRSNFDNNTIQKIQQLKSRQEISGPLLPEGRINPFVE